MNDIMVEHLIELQKELDKENVNFVLGGGMSLYIRQIYLERSPSPRYPFSIATRSTQDIDVFLNSKVIVDFEKIDKLKTALENLGYEPSEEAKYFQFEKEIKLAGSQQTVKIDLLAAPPKEDDKVLVKISKPRIRPKKSKNIHAYLTDEAAGIDMGKIPIELKDSNNKTVTVYIPSSFNYLILKLYAFDERKDRSEAKSDYGRHHAFDIFATVCQMDESDWDNAKTHFENDKDCDYLKKACQISQKNFTNLTDMGIIRLKENQNYRNQREEFEPTLPSFLEDLKDLFAIRE